MDSSDRHSGKRRTGLFILILLALVLMILSVVLISGLPEEYSLKPSNSTSGSELKVQHISCDMTEARKIYPFGNGLLKISNYNISYVDLNGNEKFGETVDMETPACDINGDYALVLDTDGTSFMLLSSEKILYSAQATGTIDFGSVNKDGYVAIVYDKPAIKGAARFLKPDGTEIFEWESVESGFIVVAHVSEKLDAIDILTYNTDGVDAFPIYKSFDFAGNAKSQNFLETDDIVSLVLYDDKDNVILCGSSYIFLSGKEKQFHKDFNNIYLASSAQSGLLVVAKEASTDTPMLYAVDLDGKTSQGILLSEEVVSLNRKQNIAVVGYGPSIVCVDLKTMEVIKRVSFNSTVIRAAINSNGDKAIIVTGEGVFSYSIG